jgi:hypothetical protein
MLVAAVAVTAAICGGYVAVHPFARTKTTPHTSASPAPALWHEVTIASQGFQVSLPCVNTIKTPKQDAYGLLESVAGPENVGYTSVECSTTLTDTGTARTPEPVGCDIQAFDGNIPDPSRLSSPEAWLRTISSDQKDPVITLHGATAIYYAEPGNQELFAVINNSYYQLEADCSPAAVGVGKTYLFSFAPLNN